MATIALVDDDRNILTSVSIALENEGHHVRTYTDGASALAALTATPPDLAVLDIKMPRMDGMELLRRLRAAAWCAFHLALGVGASSYDAAFVVRQPPPRVTVGGRR